MFLIKPFSGILGVLVLLYIGWIFLAGHPSERIDRGCRPIGWAGNVLTSISAIAAPSLSQATYRVFKNTEYTCQYAIWRLMYEREWYEYQRSAAVAGTRRNDAAVGRTPEPTKDGPGAQKHKPQGDNK